jgi:hypothetical protein
MAGSDCSECPVRPSDFHIHSDDGVGIDWSISYWDPADLIQLSDINSDAQLATGVFPLDDTANTGSNQGRSLGLRPITACGNQVDRLHAFLVVEARLRGDPFPPISYICPALAHRTAHNHATAQRFSFRSIFKKRFESRQ